jgi:hypothetical protein
MGFLQFAEVQRSRGVWRDPARKLRTLESFAQTEEDGGRDLLVAARRVATPTCAGTSSATRRTRRSTPGCSGAARRSSAPSCRRTTAAKRPDKPYDLSRGRGAEVDAHGFFNAGLIDELGEVDYVAMLHVAELRAAKVFEMHRELAEDDARMRAIFDEILKDEKYHCAYTGKFLERWRGEGRALEVQRGMKAARGSRLLGAWKRLGVRSAAGLSRVVLYAMYWTVLAPFGLLSRRSERARGWREAQRRDGDAFGQA